ncbi:MAG: hypothetical protein JO063_10110 [Pseudonocardiales bacterium]|nr:hypothetical protein [Pseudonocardiales bacterium]MBV9029374.1 hypothetical protein [Pseudonocardiales bacterium]MBW0010452.1 hypothetical protein [Pseudonocardiales bacterium]
MKPGPGRRGGATPKTALVGWVFLKHPRGEGVTIRWRRGEPVAYVLHGRRIGDDTTATGVLDTIPVAPTGWTDLAEIRLLGQRWLRQR